jgi:PEP-CTERM/exosortase A-associated glycosyltransferase
MRVLHVLDHSLPHFSGYGFRSDYLLRAQRRLGLDPVVVTSPKHGGFKSECETVDGIDYHRLRPPKFFSRVPLLSHAACLTALANKIGRLAEELRVDVLHAHSPATNGLAASRAAQALNLPMVYELRYYEEDAAVDRNKTTQNSLRYRLVRGLEQVALARAARVTTISGALRADLVSRRVAPDKIVEIPNGVDPDFFRPCEPDADLIARHNLSGVTVVGFIGSFYRYEGLEHLIDAVLSLLAARRDVKLLLVGGGEADRMLRARVPEPLESHFIFTGNVAHADVRRYYSVMDILVYPRVNSRLTELTTPLKPLEAMSMGKAVVGSDVGGLRELFYDGESGFLVEPENPRALAKRLLDLIANASTRQAMGKRARELVLRERAWDLIAPRYLDVYQEALATLRV